MGSAPAIEAIARNVAREEYDAILGFILRELAREGGWGAVLDGIAAHAYYLARDDGKDAAKEASREARARAERIMGSMDGRPA